LFFWIAKIAKYILKILVVVLV